MILKLYSVFDSKQGMFAPPFSAISDEAAIRSWGDDVNYEDQKNAWFNHSEDFSLYVVGEIDTQKGIVKGVPPAHMVAGSALKKSK